MQDYHQLDIWQRGMDFAVQIYKFSADLPEGERFNLTSQMRRAATSVPLNIAEGAACSTNAEFARFLGYAYRSLKEIVTCLELCDRLYQAMPGVPATILVEEGERIARMTRSLMQRLVPGNP
jgi:four helix bundle protein